MSLMQYGSPTNRIAKVGCALTFHTQRFSPFKAGFDSSNWTALNEDGTNNITTVSDYVFTMIGDGGTDLGNQINVSIVGSQFRLTLNVTGTGAFRINADSAAVATGLSAGVDQSFTFTTDGTGNITISRDVALGATNLTFTLISLEIFE